MEERAFYAINVKLEFYLNFRLKGGTGSAILNNTDYFKQNPLPTAHTFMLVLKLVAMQNTSFAF